MDIEGKSKKEVEKILDNEIGRKWQEVSDRETDDGDWITNLVPRVSNEHMELVERPNFFLSQAVTGHGAFGEYLFKIRKRTTPVCPCGAVSQNAEHVFGTIKDTRQGDQLIG